MEMGALRILLTGLILDSALSVNHSPGSQAAERVRLHNTLLRDYDRHQVPLDPINGTGVNVTIYMWPYDILYVNEARGSIKISGWIDMRWRDPFLKWKPEEFGGIQHTHIPSSAIWLPIVDLFYSKEDVKVAQKCTECPVRTDHEGNVLQGYYFSYSFPCSINVKYFPFDNQRCTLELANWHLDDSMMDLYAEGTSVDLSIFLSNEEWDLISMNVTRKREFYNYGYFPILSYSLKISRKSGYYVQNLVIPTLILTVTALLGYHMPSTGSGIHQEKVKMGLTTILSIFILQLGVSDKLPRSSDVIPLIFIFYSCMVGLLSFAIISTSLVILLEKQGIYGKPIPKFWRRFIPGLSVTDNVRATPTAVSNADRRQSLHKHCRMLDCGCRLKASPRPGYALLSPEASPEPNRYFQLRRTLGGMGGDTLCNGSSGTATIRRHVSLSRNCADCEEDRTPASTPVAPPSSGLLTVALLESLQELRSLGQERGRAAERKAEGSRIREEWRRAADVAEYCSLFLFLASSALFTLLFAYHGWY